MTKNQKVFLKMFKCSAQQLHFRGLRQMSFTRNPCFIITCWNSVISLVNNRLKKNLKLLYIHFTFKLFFYRDFLKRLSLSSLKKKSTNIGKFILSAALLRSFFGIGLESQ